MSTFREVNDVRRDGRLDEAYELAKKGLAEKPNDIWLKRAMSWVLNDKARQEKDITGIIAEIKDLNLDANEENMFYDNIVWTIGKNIINQGVYSNYIDKVFAAIKPMKFNASEGYTYLFKSFHKYKGEWKQYAEFCEWWNFDNFLIHDYNKFRTQNGQEIMSIVEQAYIGYSQALINNGNTEKILAFLPKIEKLATDRKDYQYPPYFTAKLYQKIGNKEAAFETILPFVRKKPNDFWVWQTLGDTCTDNETQFYCYSKALTCPCKPEMLVSIKETYAQMLANRRFYNEARTEIDQVLKIRQQKSWRITDTLRGLTSEEWYKNATTLTDNKAFYKKQAESAENIVVSDLTCLSIVITHIDPVKKIANFITTDKKNGMFIYSRLFKKAPEIGTTFDAHFSELTKSGFGKVAKITACTNKEKWANLIIDFDGYITIDKERRFGIIKSGSKSIYVPKSMLNNLENTDGVSGRAVASYDKKMKKDGWTAINVKRLW